MKALVAFTALLVSGMLWAAQAARSPLQVEVFAGNAANVNAFVLSDSAGTLLIDATRNSQDAAELAKLARAHGRTPYAVLVTHGHPDHYLGLGQLKREFPKLRILVANPQIKDDLVGFAETAAKNGWLSDEPLMRPKSTANPGGFDYANQIEVLTGKTLDLPAGARLEVLSDFPATEAAHETLLYSKDLNALFASDLAYNGVHLWLAREVDAKSVANWRTEIRKLKTKYGLAKVYPGHGATTDAAVFELDLRYIRDFFEIVGKAKSPEEAKAAMIAKYPTWENADFILVQSIKTHFPKPGK